MIFRINKGQGTNMAEAGERAGRVYLKKKKYKQRKKKDFIKARRETKSLGHKYYSHWACFKSWMASGHFQLSLPWRDGSCERKGPSNIAEP